MRYVENSNVLFDKIDGRFVSSEMVGKYEIKEIKIFYNSVLPNLGWKKVKENIFEPWAENISELSKIDSLNCKISGMVEEMNDSQEISILKNLLVKKHILK